MLGRLLFRAAKSPAVGRLAGYAFQYAGWAVPVKKVPAGRKVLAFRHPRPAYEGHIVITPRKAIRSLRQMADDGLDGYFAAVWEAVWRICAERPGYADGFTLVANYGRRQEVQQVHFHLFTGHALVNDGPVPAGCMVCRAGAACAWEHPEPVWERQYAISSDAAGGDVSGVLECFARLEAQDDAVRQGCSLVYRHAGGGRPDVPVFQVTAGGRLG